METLTRSMNRAEWLMLVLLSMLWGGSFFFIGVAVTGLPPFSVVALRVGLAAVVLHLVIRAMGVSLPTDGRCWLAFGLMGLLNNLIPFCLIVWGQTHIASGLAAILNATTPFFGVVAAHCLTRDEKMTGRRLLGVLLGIAGVTAMLGPESLQGVGTDLVAELAVLGAALSYALAGIFGRRFHRMGLKPAVVATGQVSVSALLFLPLAAAVDRPWNLVMPALEVWGAIAGLALLSTVCAYILYFRILATAGATNVLLVTFLIPVSAIVLGTTLLGERLEGRHLIGMAVIGLGLAAIDGRLLQLAKRALAWRTGTINLPSLTGEGLERSHEEKR